MITVEEYLGRSSRILENSTDITVFLSVSGNDKVVVAKVTDDCGRRYREGNCHHQRSTLR